MSTIYKKYIGAINYIPSKETILHFLRGRGVKNLLKRPFGYFMNKANFTIRLSKEWVLYKKQLLLISFNIQRKIVFPKFDESAIVIVVNNCENRHNNYMCLQSIYQHTKKNYRVFIVVSNIKDLDVSDVENIVVVESPNTEDVFLSGYQLIKEMISPSEYVLFLDGNCLVTGGYLDSMLSLLEKNQCEVVSGKIVDTYNKTVLHAGSIIAQDGIIKVCGFGEPTDRPEYSYVRRIDLPAEACILMRRNDLDKFCKNGMLNQVSFVKSILKNNSKILFQPRSIIKYQTPEKINSLSSEPINFIDFEEEKYRKNLKRNVRILVLDDYIPAIRYGSGFPRLREMLLCLSDLGYFVTFFPVSDPTYVQPETIQLQEKGIEVFGGLYANFKSFIKKRGNQYDVVLTSRPHVFQKYYSLIKENFPDSAILYDAEAIFYLRRQAKDRIRGKIENKQFANLAKQEIQLLEKADLVISVSSREKEIMFQEGSQKNIEVWGHIQDVKENEVQFNQRHGILFLGSFFAGRDSPNEDAALYFTQNIFPMILDRIDCMLYIVGTDPTKAVKGLTSRRVEVTGYVENLEDYFYTCRVNVVPTRFAAGIPLKLLQAMAYGIPSVVSNIIAEQLGLQDGEQVLVANTTQEFAEKIVSIYSDQLLWNKLSRNSSFFIEKNFSRKELQEKLDYIIKKSISLHAKKLQNQHCENLS